MREIITSRQNPRIKEVAALTDKKARRKSGLFRFDGIKLFGDALGLLDIQSVFVREPQSPRLAEILQKAIDGESLSEEKVVYVSESVFEKISEENAPEGIITVAKKPEMLHIVAEDADIEDIDLKEELLLMAESLRDAGNLGTVIRSCAALGIDRLIISDDCADLYNPKTVRSAMGALFRLPIVTVKKEEMPILVQKLKRDGRKVYAAALSESAEEIGTLKLSRGDCFIIGNEGHGLSEELIEACSGSAIIPMREGNDSLNAAAAAAICIWETVKASVK